MKHVTFSPVLFNLLFNRQLLEKLTRSRNSFAVFNDVAYRFFLVSGDNANTLKDMPTKGDREEKEQVSATTTIATPTTSLAIIEPSEKDVTTPEYLWKEDKLTNEAESSPAQQTTIRNTSDARGIFSNMVKTLNKCKSTIWSLFFLSVL